MLTLFKKEQSSELQKIRHLTLAAHALLWFTMFAILMNYLLKELEFAEAIFVSFLGTLSSAIPFYINYLFLTDLIFKKREYVKYFLFLSLLLSVLLYIANFTELAWLLIDENAYSINVDLITYFILFTLISNFLKGLEIWLLNKHRSEMLLREKLQAELNFLRLQINPHFLFNILNNIYSLAYAKDDKAPDMISRLSLILRYMLYECKGERVPLKKELELLKNYSDLQQLKLEDERNIDFYDEGIQSQQIAPLILISVLENSFKHSDIATNKQGWIKVDFIVADKVFIYSVSNSISEHVQSTSEYSGIGYENFEKQLQLNYPENYTLDVKHEDGSHIVHLTINLD